jgi:hypothetical protein
MYKLFTDKTEIFECNVQIEGASLEKSVARIVVESEELNLMFNGTIDKNGKCQIPIKKLRGILGENIKGNLKLEVIAEDAYFVPWSSAFTVEAAKKVTVEVKSQNANTIVESAPRVAVTGIPAKNQPKQAVAVPIQEHIAKLVSILIREDFDLYNLKIKKDRLNNIIGTYLQKNPIKENQKPALIQGIINKLPK